MKRLALAFASSIAALVVMSAVDRASAQAPPVNVKVTNDSAFANSYELFDNVCNRPMASISLPAHGATTLTLCSSGALNDGYGSFKARKTDVNYWNNFDMIRNGESRSLN